MIQHFLTFYLSTTFIFLVQYFLGTVPFLAVLPRKEGLGLRLALLLTLYIAESLLLAAVFNLGLGAVFPQAVRIVVCVFFFALVLCFALTIAKIFRISYGQAFFFAAGGYAIEHISEMVSQVILLFFAGTEAPAIVSTTLLRVGVSLAVSLIFYFGLIRKAGRDGANSYRDRRVWAVSLINLFICIILSVFAEPLTKAEAGSRIGTVVYKLYAIVGCSLSILLQMNFFRENRLSAEKKQLQEVLDISRKQQRISKETIDLINIKCHDIKYHIRMLGQDHSDESVRRMTELIEIYDSICKTGNDTLDLVLMKKKLLCEGKGIEFKIVADGKQLDFMDDGDIYVLFGNLLDNAVESSSRNPDAEGRFIRLDIFTRGDILYISEENDCTEPPVIDGAFPRTIKTEGNGHGYGVRSMDYLVRQYGGEIVFDTENGLFRVEIMIPLPGQKRKNP